MNPSLCLCSCGAPPVMRLVLGAGPEVLCRACFDAARARCVGPLFSAGTYEPIAAAEVNPARCACACCDRWRASIDQFVGEGLITAEERTALTRAG